MNVWIIYRRDRFLRASDHVPFLDRRYPANRFTEPNEDFRHQHQNVRVENGVQFGDLPQFVDFDYATRVAHDQGRQRDDVHRQGNHQGQLPLRRQGPSTATATEASSASQRPSTGSTSGTLAGKRRASPCPWLP
jgi:hypothetical protein